MRFLNLFLIILLSISSDFIYASGLCLDKALYDFDNESQINEKMGGSVFLLEVISSEGTYAPLGNATLITDSGHLITAKHLFNYKSKNKFNVDKYRLTHTDSYTLEKENFLLETVNHHPSADLSVLKVKGWKKNTFVPIKLQLRFDENPNRVQLYSYTLDNPDLASASSTGKITRKNNNYSYIVDQIKPYNGQSGSILINQYLDGVGVLSGYILDDGTIVDSYEERIERKFKFINVVSSYLVKDIISSLEIDETNYLITKFLENPGPFSDVDVRHSLKYSPISYYLAVVKIIEEYSDVFKSLSIDDYDKFLFQFNTYATCFLDERNIYSYYKELRSIMPSNTISQVIASQVNRSRNETDLKNSLGLYLSANSMINANEDYRNKYISTFNYTALDLVNRLSNEKTNDEYNYKAIASVIINDRIKDVSKGLDKLSDEQIHSSQLVLLSASKLSKSIKSQYAGSQFSLAAFVLGDKYSTQDNLLERSESDFKYHVAQAPKNDLNISNKDIDTIMKQIKSLNSEKGSIKNNNVVDLSGAIKQFDVNAFDKIYQKTR